MYLPWVKPDNIMMTSQIITNRRSIQRDEFDTASSRATGVRKNAALEGCLGGFDLDQL